jgi:CubicO group peptidase (beta-lactamase class C family)
VDDYIRVLGGRPPTFEPGTGYEYSNYGFILLEAIVERVSGLPFERCAAERIFAPAGMTSTFLRASDTLARTRAHGYRRVQGTLMAADAWNYRDGDRLLTPYSTAADLMRFAEALQAGRLISSASLATATRPVPGQPFALGFMLRDDGRLLNYGHGGISAGVNADVRIVPELGYVVVGLSNFEVPAADRLTDFYMNRMPVD